MAEWTEDVLTILSLASRGVMVLLDHADDAHLRELFLAVREAHPAADVVLTPEALFDAAPGSVVVYLPLAEHADALNAGRPLVAERELRVLLWCDAETTSALATKAPDFYDWISHVVECPDKPAPWVVATFRCAMEYPDVPGVVWMGEGSPEAGIEAAGGKLTKRISIEATPEEMVGAAAGDQEGWLWFEGVNAQTMIEVRWACAEARRIGRVVVSGGGLWEGEATEGWWCLEPAPYNIRTAVNYYSGSEHDDDLDGPGLTPAELAAIGAEPGTWNNVDMTNQSWRDAMTASVTDPGAWIAEIAIRLDDNHWAGVNPSSAASARVRWASEIGVRERAEYDKGTRNRIASGEISGSIRAWATRNALDSFSFSKHLGLEGHAPYLLEALLRGGDRGLIQQQYFYVLSNEAPLRWRLWWLRALAEDGTVLSASAALARGIEVLSQDAFTEAQRWIQSCLVSAKSDSAEAYLISPATAAAIRTQVESASVEMLATFLPIASKTIPIFVRHYSVTALDKLSRYVARHVQEIGPEVVAEFARLFLREGDLARADVLLNLLPEAFAHPAVTEVRCELWFERGEHALLTQDAATLSPGSEEARRVEVLRIRSAIRLNDPTAQPALADLVATVSKTETTTREARILQAQAEFLLSQGTTSEALAVAERARAIFAERYDPTHPAVGSMLMLAGEALLRLGRYQEGRQHLEKAVEVLSERLGRAHHTTLQARLLLALEHRRGPTPDAMEPINPLLAQLTARLGSHHPWVRRLTDLAEDPRATVAGGEGLAARGEATSPGGEATSAEGGGDFGEGGRRLRRRGEVISSDREPTSRGLDAILSGWGTDLVGRGNDSVRRASRPGDRGREACGQQAAKRPARWAFCAAARRSMRRRVLHWVRWASTAAASRAVASRG